MQEGLQRNYPSQYLEKGIFEESETPLMKRVSKAILYLVMHLSTSSSNDHQFLQLYKTRFICPSQIALYNSI